jgi:hypothetical protein
LKEIDVICDLLKCFGSEKYFPKPSMLDFSSPEGSRKRRWYALVVSTTLLSACCLTLFWTPSPPENEPYSLIVHAQYFLKNICGLYGCNTVEVRENPTKAIKPARSSLKTSQNKVSAVHSKTVPLPSTDNEHKSDLKAEVSLQKAEILYQQSLLRRQDQVLRNMMKMRDGALAGQQVSVPSLGNAEMKCFSKFNDSNR